MTNSIEASSKNPMKRKCKGCNSTDNQRNYAARHNPQVKKDYQILSPKSKVKYYVSGKRKWENSEKQRKVKSEMKVSAQISERTSEVARGLEEDVYEPFENFAVRKIILKEAADKAGAWILFQKELEAGHPAMMKRGVWCLGRFKGFKVQSGTETSLDTNKSQKRKIESTDDIEEFNKEAQRLRKKVRRISAVHYLQVDGSYHTMEGEKELHPSMVEGQVTFELKDADTSTLDGSSDTSRNHCVSAVSAHPRNEKNYNRPGKLLKVFLLSSVCFYTSRIQTPRRTFRNPNSETLNQNTELCCYYYHILLCMLFMLTFCYY